MKMLKNPSLNHKNVIETISQPWECLINCLLTMKMWWKLSLNRENVIETVSQPWKYEGN